MKNYKSLGHWHMAIQPFSLVPPPLKNVIYFNSLLIISDNTNYKQSTHEMLWDGLGMDARWIWNMKTHCEPGVGLVQSTFNSI